MLRAQCSLIFQDKVLYDNFVEPLRKSKELNSVIVRCLSAYYRDVRVRSLVDDGVYLPDESDVQNGEGGEEQQSVQQMFDNIRANFAVQDFILSSMESAIDNGMEQATDILDKANSSAEEKGGMRQKQTSYGTVLINTTKDGVVEKKAKSESSMAMSKPDLKAFTQAVENGDMSSALLQLGSLVSNLYSMLGNGVGNSIAGMSAQSEEQVSTETTMNSQQHQVPLGSFDEGDEISVDELSSSDVDSIIAESDKADKVESESVIATSSDESDVESSEGSRIGSGAALLNQALSSALGL